MPTTMNDQPPYANGLTLGILFFLCIFISQGSRKGHNKVAKTSCKKVKIEIMIPTIMPNIQIKFIKYKTIKLLANIRNPIEYGNLSCSQNAVKYLCKINAITIAIKMMMFSIMIYKWLYFFKVNA